MPFQPIGNEIDLLSDFEFVMCHAILATTGARGQSPFRSSNYAEPFLGGAAEPRKRTGQQSPDALPILANQQANARGPQDE
jgi:hypothetical protein